MMLNPNNFFNGGTSGLLTKTLRTTSGRGATPNMAIVQLITDLQTALTAAGAAGEATACGTLLTYLATPANVDLVIAKY